MMPTFNLPLSIYLVLCEIQLTEIVCSNSAVISTFYHKYIIFLQQRFLDSGDFVGHNLDSTNYKILKIS